LSAFTPDGGRVRPPPRSIDGPIFPLVVRSLVAWILIGTYYAAERVTASVAGGPPCCGHLSLFISTLLKSAVWTVITVVLFRYSAQISLSASRVRLLATHAPVALIASLAVIATNVGIARLVGDRSATFDHLLATGFHRALLDAMIVFGLAYSIRTYEHSSAAAVRSAHLETELTQAQLRALQSQLQPHFLFNTLQSISTLLHHHPDRAERMIYMLGELLRATMSAPERLEIPFGEEIAFVDHYLAIQQVRFSDRIRVHRRIDPMTRGLLVPPFLLQPLVENSLKHGLSQCEDGGEISIDAAVTGGKLVVRVSDSGAGCFPAADAPHAGGIGIRNIKSRLARQYGDASSVELLSGPNGTTVTLRLPVVHARAESLHRPGRTES
jgi:two-component system, LytTR family, sensor kinase